MLASSAIEADVNSFLERFADQKTVDGHKRVVRNGRLPGRCIQTGVGAIEVNVPRIRDREKTVRQSCRRTFVGPRHGGAVAVVIPERDFDERFPGALTALLGRDAPGLSASTISRIKARWTEEHQRWSPRVLSNRRYVYLWVDGIHFGVRLEDAAQCILVAIGLRHITLVCSEA